MRQPEIAHFLKLPLGRLALTLAVSLLWVMFFTACGGIFAWFLGTNDKNETITYIGLGLGGVLAAMGAHALNRRAEAVADHNKLVEKGHINERIKVAMESLGHAEPSVRIAAFYQFYHLTKDSKDNDFVKNIFDILCAHLRQITSKKDYRQGEGKSKPTEECQSLLDVLFKNQQNLFAGIAAQLRDTYLVGANLREANLQNAFFARADLRGVIFARADLQGVIFANADLRKTHFNDADLRGAWFLFSKAHKASFKDANIKDANFGGGSMHYADLHAAQNLTGEGFITPIEINASDAKHYPDWFKKGKHYTVSKSE